MERLEQGTASLIKHPPKAGRTGVMNKKRSLAASFKHAWEGVLACVKNERNMRIHLAAMCVVTAGGFLLRISTAEWLVCLLFFALVPGAEAVNTAVEALTDICSPQANSKAKLAKDAASGAVLICAMMAAIAGCVIFVPKILALMG